MNSLEFGGYRTPYLYADINSDKQTLHRRSKETFSKLRFLLIILTLFCGCSFLFNASKPVLYLQIIAMMVRGRLECHRFLDMSDNAGQTPHAGFQIFIFFKPYQKRRKLNSLCAIDAERAI